MGLRPTTVGLRPSPNSIWNLVSPWVIWGVYLKKIRLNVARDMRSSTPTHLMFMSVVHMHAHWSILCSLPSNPIFFHHPQILHCLQAISTLRMCVCMYHFQYLVIPWYLPDNHTKFHKDPTSPSWNIKVSLLPQVACTFLLTVCEQAHVYAHEHYQST